MKQLRQVCVLLPDKRHLDCAVRATARGQEVLHSVSEQLGISDPHVFGLAVLRDDEFLFLDLEQKLRKYFGKKWNRGSSMVPFILFLKVQYYVESGRLILSSAVLQLYYTELRQKVLLSQSRHQEALLFQLAASALQAEVGDLERSEAEEGKTHEQYFLPEDYFPSWLMRRRGREYLLRHGPVLHAELRGVTRSRARLRFIREAACLDDALVTFYRARQEKKDQKCTMLLGVTLKGVQIYQEVEGKQCLLYHLCWTDIDRLTFQGSRFEIHAVASLCLPKLLYYTRSTFHSQHLLKHLRDSHEFHISTRDTRCYIQELEDMQAGQFYNEAYVCDTACLKQRLCNSIASSISDCSVPMETTPGWTTVEEEGHITEFEQCVDEPPEVFVDDPAEVSWLAELLHGASPGGTAALPPSCWSAITSEMKQVLRNRADAGV